MTDAKFKRGDVVRVLHGGNYLYTARGSVGIATGGYHEGNYVAVAFATLTGQGRRGCEAILNNSVPARTFSIHGCDLERVNASQLPPPTRVELVKLQLKLAAEASAT